MLIGRTVRHARFGEGEILGVDGRYMTVRFSSGEKRFVYPDAFASYLTVCEPEAEAEIAEATLAAERLREQQRDRCRRERECLSEHGSVIEGRRRVQELPDGDTEYDG